MSFRKNSINGRHFGTVPVFFPFQNKSEYKCEFAKHLARHPSSPSVSLFAGSLTNSPDDSARPAAWPRIGPGKKWDSRRKGKLGRKDSKQSKKSN